MREACTATNWIRRKIRGRRRRTERENEIERIFFTAKTDFFVNQLWYNKFH